MCQNRDVQRSFYFYFERENKTQEGRHKGQKIILHDLSYFTNSVFHDGQPGEGVGLSRPFTQEEGKIQNTVCYGGSLLPRMSRRPHDSFH